MTPDIAQRSGAENRVGRDVTDDVGIGVPERTTLRRIITSVLSGDVFHEGAGPQPHWASFLVKQYPAEVPSFA